MKVEISKDKVKFSEIEPGELFIWNNELLVKIRGTKDDGSLFNVFNLITSELMAFDDDDDDVKPFLGSAVISNSKK